jgi:hypothetical protein
MYVYEAHQSHSFTFVSSIHPPSPTSTHKHTVPIFKSCLSLLIPKSMLKGFSPCIPAVSTLYFVQFNPFHYSPLPLPFCSPTLFNSFKYIYYILYQHRCYLFLYCWFSFSFPFPPPQSSIEQFHYYKQVLHVNLYMIMLVLCICLSFGSIFHIWEKTCVLCLSEPGLLHLTWSPLIASIYL